MATIEVIKYCNETLLKGWRNIEDDQPTTVDLALLGIESEVQEAELVKMSKDEQQRHVLQDISLLAVYGDSETKNPWSLRAEIIATAKKTMSIAEIPTNALQLD